MPVPRMPMVAVGVAMRRCPRPNPDSSLPVTNRSDAISIPSPAVRSSLPWRSRNASLPTTNTASPPAAVTTLSPGVTKVPVFAALPLPRTSPLIITMPPGGVRAASAARSSSGMAAPTSSARLSQSRRPRANESPPDFIFGPPGTASFSAQFPPQDLAYGRLRQAVAEFHVLRDLVAGKLPLAVLDHGFFAQVRILFYDHHFHRLARFVVRHTDSGALEHARVHRDHAL